MEFKKEILKTLIYLKNQGLDRREVERRLNYAENYIDQALSKGGNSKLLNALTILLQKSNIDNTDVNIMEEPVAVYENKKKIDPDKALDTIYNLSESNKIAIQTNAKLASMLESRIEKTTANGVQEMLTAFDAKLAAALEFVAEVGAGTRWHTKEEANAAIGKMFFDKLQPAK